MATQHYFLHSSLLVCSLSLMSSGCGAFDRSPTEAGISANRASIPDTPPSIVGQITGITLPTVMVEENPTEAHGSAKASVRIKTDTRVVHRQRGSVGSKELKIGQRVKVWFSGPVMESYPAQASAAVIVIESSVPLK